MFITLGKLLTNDTNGESQGSALGSTYGASESFFIGGCEGRSVGYHKGFSWGRNEGSCIGDTRGFSKDRNP